MRIGFTRHPRTHENPHKRLGLQSTEAAAEEGAMEGSEGSWEAHESTRDCQERGLNDRGSELCAVLATMKTTSGWILSKNGC